MGSRYSTCPVCKECKDCPECPPCQSSVNTSSNVVSTSNVVSPAPLISLAPSVPSSITKATDWGSDGSGNAIFLDRHNIQCDSGVLSRMHLVRNPDGSRFRYEYVCSNVPNLKAPVDSSTNWGADGGGNAIYLDRHNIQCGDNSYLSKMKMNRLSNENNYRYDYSCRTAPNTLICETRSTPSNDDGGGNSTFLDRHDVKCNDNEALSHVQLKRDGLNKYHYEFSCCRNAG